MASVLPARECRFRDVDIPRQLCEVDVGGFADRACFSARAEPPYLGK